MPERAVDVVPKSRLRFFRRAIFQQLMKRQVQVSSRQVDHIRRSIESSGARLLHVYFGHIGVYLLPLLRLKTVPTVVSFHGADAGVDLDKGWHNEAINEVFSLADRILVRSESLRRGLVEVGCAEEKIRLNRTGIPLDDWPMHERSWAENQQWKMLQACRLIEKKGLDLTLQVLAQLRESSLDVTLMVAGEGPLRESLAQQAAELGIADRVRFIGFVDQQALAKEIRRAHLFIHPSRMGADGNQEGVPNSMLEAMASGLPVIATRHGGIPEAVEHEKSGLLVNEEDVEGLVRECQRLMANEALYRQLSDGARASVAERFSREAQIELLEKCYLELI